MSLGNFAENIYNSNVSLDAAKQEQRGMENMLENFVDYSPVKTVHKNQRANILLNAREFYKGRKEFLIAFEENMFPLPKPYVFGENEWKERDLRKISQKRSHKEGYKKCEVEVIDKGRYFRVNRKDLEIESDVANLAQISNKCDPEKQKCRHESMPNTEFQPCRRFLQNNLVERKIKSCRKSSKNF